MSPARKSNRSPDPRGGEATGGAAPGSGGEGTPPQTPQPFPPNSSVTSPTAIATCLQAAKEGKVGHIQPFATNFPPAQSPDDDILSSRAVEQEVLDTIDTTATPSDCLRPTMTPQASATNFRPVAKGYDRKARRTRPYVNRRQANGSMLGDVLGTPEQQEAFCQSIIEHRGVKPACKEWGLPSSSVFYYLNSHEGFREKYMIAKRSLQEDIVEDVKQRNDKLLSMEPKEMNLCANAYRCANEQDMRMLGILNRAIFGEKPLHQVNIQNNTGIMCDEPTRARLIELNAKLLADKSDVTTTTE